MCLDCINKCGWAPLPRKVAFKDNPFTFLWVSEMRSWQLWTSGRFQVRFQVTYALLVTMIKKAQVGHMAKGTEGWQERQTLICSSVTKSCPFFWDPMDCSTPGSLVFIISRSLLKFMSFEPMMLSNHLILCHSIFCLPSIFPSIRVFSNELALRITWPKYWSFNFSISHSNGHSGLISFRIDWLDCLVVQETVKSLF